MIKLPNVGRKPLGREPTNITLPKDLKSLAQADVDSRGETLGDLVEVLLRRHYGWPEKFATPAEKPKPKRAK